MERIIDPENLKKAWKRVKANAGAAGIDGMNVSDFPAYAREHWEEIHATLKKGSYRPSPVRRHEIPKPDGGMRPLGIPTVMDRVIQQAIAQVLEPTWEPQFADRSYGFRPGRSAHGAIRRLRDDLKTGRRVAVDLDLAKFFDRVNHDVLMHRLGRRVGDKTLLKLIGRYLRAGVCVEGRVEPTREGVPQGGPLSPLLANIMLDDLDKELEARGHRFVRYADDFIVLVKSPRAGERVKASLQRFLSQKLKLQINEAKSRVAPVEQCTFLGFTLKGKSIRWAERSLEKFKRRIRELTGRSWGVSMKYRLKELTVYVRGWMNYFGIAEYYKPIPELDKWLRRRMRMCYWKMWKRPRTRISKLRKLGTFPCQAILTALSRKGCWHLSKTLATQHGMTDRWLYEQGLPCLKSQWVAIHYPNTSK